MAVTGDNSTFKSSFRRNIVDSFIDGFDFKSTDKYFLFIGKVDGWTGGETFDSIPDTRYDDIDVWRNIVGIKQIDINSAYRMTDRYDWTNNTIYTPYDDTVDMQGVKYYAMNTEYNVYKCLANNNGIASSAEPKGIKTDSAINTSDGYVWKYMYTVPEPYRYYIDDEFIPVSKLVAKGVSSETKNQWSTQTGAKRGGIESVLLEVTGNWNHGSIFPAGSTGTIQTATSLAGATAMELNSTYMAGSFSDDAFNGMTVTITTDVGAGQRRIITDYVASTNLIYFETPLSKNVPAGSVIEIAPKIDIYGDGVSAEAFIDLYNYEASEDNRKQIRKVDITNPGKDYSYTEVEISPVDVASALVSGDIPQIRAIVSPPKGHGADVARELNATSILLVVNIDQDEDSAFFMKNDVRQYGIIKNPVLNDTAPEHLDVNGYPHRLAGETSILNTYLEVTSTAVTGSFLPESLYTVGNYVVGKDSKATGKIEAWSPSIQENHGTLTISGLQGEFVAPVDAVGTGEGIIEFSQDGDSWAFSPVAGLAEVSAFDKIYQNTTPAFSCTTTLGISGGPGLDTETFPIDIGVTGGNATTGCTGCPTGMVLDWVPDTTGTGGTLVLTDIKGTFNTGDSIGSYSYETTTSLIHNIASPEILPFSGEIIYAQNMTPIEKEPEQREQYQIILKF